MNAIFRLDKMDPEFLSTLRERRDHLFTQRAALEERMSVIDDELRALEELVRVQERVSKLPPGEAPSPLRSAETKSNTRARNPIAPSTVGSYAREFLLESGRPLKRGALLRKFEEKGIPIIGKDRAKVLGTTLWRLRNENGDPLFLNTDRGYWPADIALPS